MVDEVTYKEGVCGECASRMRDRLMEETLIAHPEWQQLDGKIIPKHWGDCHKEAGSKVPKRMCVEICADYEVNYLCLEHLTEVYKELSDRTRLYDELRLFGGR